MWPSRCRDIKNDSGDDRIVGDCLVCKGLTLLKRQVPFIWNLCTMHDQSAVPHVARDLRSLTQRGFMQSDTCNLDKLETLSVFAEFIGHGRSFRQRVKLVVNRALVLLHRVLRGGRRHSGQVGVRTGW
jgi:hypothetical protein